MHYRFDELERLDAPLSIFTSQEIAAVRGEVERIEYPELMGRVLVPTSSYGISNGKEEIEYKILDRVGRAAWVRGKSDDFPRVDVFVKTAVARFKNFGDAYGWDVQELRTAQANGIGLDVEKPAAARDAFEEFLDVVLLTGDTEVGMAGLFTQPLTGVGAVREYTVPDGEDASPEWDDKTGAEILLDLHALSAQVYQQSNRVERIDTLVVATTSHGSLITRRDDISGDTLMNIFLANDPYIKNVFQSEKLETAGVGGTKRVVGYRRDPRVLKGLLPQDFEQFPPQWHNLKVETICMGRTGGTVVHRPGAIIYADGV